MHENRETSRVSRLSRDRDRSGKMQNRTPDTHAREESDHAIVPVNQPNKEGFPSAEVGEERAWTQENIVRFHTSPTQSGERVSQGLNGVRQAAQRNKQERFTALLHYVTIDLRRDSFYALQRKAAPGVDGLTWPEYETGVDGRLTDLQHGVKGG